MIDINKKWAIFQYKADAQKRIRTWRKISGMIDNGIPILAAIEELHKRAKTKGEKHPDVVMYADWIAYLKNGERFSVAIEEWIPKSESMIISAGEQSGDLIGAFASAITLTIAGREIRSAVIGGATYPAILFGLAAGLMWLFGTKVIPQFSKMAGDESKWTGLAEIAVKLSHFTQDYLIWVLLGALALVSLVIYSLPRWDGSLRVKLDSFPPYSIYRLTVGASWLISLSALIKAGVKLEVALQKLALGSGKWMRNRIAASLAGMRAGLQLGESLAQTGYNFPDEEIIDDLQIYAKLAGFDEALSILGKEWIEEGVARIKKQMGVLKSIAVLLVAVVIAIEAGGMFAMQSQLQTIMRN